MTIIELKLAILTLSFKRWTGGICLVLFDHLESDNSDFYNFIKSEEFNVKSYVGFLKNSL